MLVVVIVVAGVACIGLAIATMLRKK